MIHSFKMQSVVFSLICLLGSTLTPACWTLWPYIISSCLSNAELSEGFQVISVLSICFSLGQSSNTCTNVSTQTLNTQLISFWIILISFGEGLESELWCQLSLISMTNEELTSKILPSQKITTLKYNPRSKSMISFAEVSELLLDNINFKKMDVDTLLFQGKEHWSLFFVLTSFIPSVYYRVSCCLLQA